MRDVKEELVKKIKELEQKVGKTAYSKDMMEGLLSDFESLLHIEGGPFVYVNVTTPEDIKLIYDLDSNTYFDRFERKDIEFKDTNNPQNYAWMPRNIELVVIEDTPKNAELAKLIVSQIISALKGRLEIEA